MLIHLAVSSMFPKADTNPLQLATTKIIDRLTQETKRSKVLVVNLNSEIIESWVRSYDDPKISYDVNDLRRTSHFKMQKIGATILHLRNYDEFENFYSRMGTEVFLPDGHFIIIYDVVDGVEEIEKMFVKFWKMYIYNVNVLVTNSSSSNLVSVFTYMPFNDELCGNTKPIKINEFDRFSLKWKTDLFFPKKFKQLNRCPIRFGCYEYIPSFIMDRTVSGPAKISGINVDIGTIFSNVLNFTLNLIEYDKGMGVIYQNNTATALMKRVMENEVDVIFSSLQIQRVNALSATRTVQRDTTILVIPPPFLMDPMKKILLPFALDSWISIGIVALIACCVVKLLEFTPKFVHDYVIGSNVKGSVLNVWNIFLGGAQNVVPRSSFPRFLLTKFLFFSLIIRTLYQGEMFNLMKRDVHTVKLNSFDEFIAHEYTFYIYHSLANRLAGTKLLQRFD